MFLLPPDIVALAHWPSGVGIRSACPRNWKFQTKFEPNTSN